MNRVKSSGGFAPTASAAPPIPPKSFPNLSGMNGVKDSGSILTPESRIKKDPEPVCLGRTKILGDPLSSR